MSYILDALRKSEQERQVASGRGASMLYPVLAEHGPSGRLQPFLLAAALAVLVIGLLAWMWSRPSPPAAPNHTKVSETAAAPAPAALAVRPTAAADAESRARAPAPRSPPKPAIAASQAPMAAVVTPLPEPAPKKSRPPASIEAKPEPSIAALAEKSEKAETGSEPPKGVPALVIGGYIHDEQGANLAIVNDKLVREGEEVAPGLRLEKIVDDSAVFSYKGHRFRR